MASGHWQNSVDIEQLGRGATFSFAQKLNCQGSYVCDSGTECPTPGLQQSVSAFACCLFQVRGLNLYPEYSAKKYGRREAHCAGEGADRAPGSDGCLTAGASLGGVFFCDVICWDPIKIYAQMYNIQSVSDTATQKVVVSPSSKRVTFFTMP